MLIPETLYREIVDAMPVACVDVVVRNNGQVLLVKRRNEPLSGKWWVPGGRVFIGESLVSAVHRKVREDISIGVRDVRFLGYYEGTFGANRFGPTRLYHTISFVFLARPKSQAIRLGDENSDWTWARSLPAEFIIHR